MLHYARNYLYSMASPLHLLAAISEDRDGLPRKKPGFRDERRDSDLTDPWGSHGGHVGGGGGALRQRGTM